jgi:hypothetical protein
MTIGVMFETYHDYARVADHERVATMPSAPGGWPIPPVTAAQQCLPAEVPLPHPSLVPDPPEWSWPGRGDDESSRPSYLVRVALGLLWRFALVGVVTLGSLISPAVPLAAAVGVLAGGQVISLRRGAGAAAPLWRTGLIALALAVSSGLALYPKVAAGGLAWVGVEPWVLAGRPWRLRLDRLGARILSRSGQPDKRSWGVPASLETYAGWERWR